MFQFEMRDAIVDIAFGNVVPRWLSAITRRRALLRSGVRVFISSLMVFPILALAEGKDPANGGRFDGPAELPRVYMKSAIADTPASGNTVLVKTSDELKAALDKAACGDTIRLQAGAVFAGNFKLPARSCDDSHWIILRSSAADGELPPEGTRISPCYAGVASLPGRPAFACSPPKNVMPKITFNSRGSGPITLANGANHYRLVGLEITRESPGAAVSNLVFLQGADSTAHHLVFDRVWVHGTAEDDTTRGLLLGSSQDVAVVDSYFTDFHCVAMGSCTDAQAIAGGVGDQPMGPYKFVNNFLEASGENIIFGGGQGTVSPVDIEIRHNHFFKPLTWKRGNPGFVGGPSGKAFIVKNLFELKNAQRVLIEGNVLENSWGGFSQTGFAILLTPKSQSSRCPLCRVTDVVVRFNSISHMGSGMQIASIQSASGGAASGAERFAIHDNIFDDIDDREYGGFGAFAQLSSTVPPLRDIVITHNTAFPPKMLFLVGIAVDQKGSNFVFNNNLVAVGKADVSSAGGGDKNCAFRPAIQGPTGVLKSCFEGMNATRNVLIGSKGGWPQGNFYPQDASAVVEDFQGGKGGIYRVCGSQQGSKCKKKAEFLGKSSDEKDPGADVQAVTAATAGVK